MFDNLRLNFSPDVINTVSSSISDIHAFHSQNVQGSTCHVDLSVKPEVPGNHTICIKAEDQRFVKIERIPSVHVNYVCNLYLKLRNFLTFLANLETWDVIQYKWSLVAIKHLVSILEVHVYICKYCLQIIKVKAIWAVFIRILFRCKNPIVW